MLILSSLPGERSLAERRYYAHPQNQFWRLLGGAIGCDLAPLPYDDRLAALLAGGVGLWDVIARAHRTGSTDAALRDVETNDLAALVARLPALGTIAFNGGAAARIGRAALVGAAVELLDLPSSSPLHTVGIAAKRPAWDALGERLAR